ncbi:MAG: hypothetical protein L6461_11225 [Anaerolineae bacterium]|nr:hypothetical protein [Anaerolineae bacterium]
MSKKKIPTIMVIIPSAIILWALYKVFDIEIIIAFAVVAGAFFSLILLYRSAVNLFSLAKRQHKPIAPQSEPSKKHATLTSFHYEEVTYDYVDDMPPRARQNYNEFLTFLNKMPPNQLVTFLSSIRRDDLAASLKEALEMKHTGLISEDEFISTKHQLLD